MLHFRVRSGDDVACDVHFEKSGDDVRMSCTCDASQRGTHCPHGVELLKGDVRSLLSGNIGDVVRLRELIDGTRLAAAIDALTSAEVVQANARIERERWKKAVDRLLQRFRREVDRN